MLTMKRLCQLAVMAWAATLGAAAHAAGTCSTYIGAATLNEYNHQSDFVEVKRLNTAVSMTGWKIRLYTSSSSYVLKTLPAAESCGEYSVVSFASNQTPFDTDIVLLDQNDNVVDLVRTRTALPASDFYVPYPVCGFHSTPTDVQIEASRKGVDRSPDGVGSWRNTPGTGSGSFASRCGGNTPDGSAADLSVSKTASMASIALDGSVSFTITVTNLGPSIASTVAVSELLPAGLSYVSHTVTAGAYNATTGLWTLGSLAVNGSHTLTLVATGTESGSLINTATALSNNSDPVTANNSASATVMVQSSAGAFNAVDVGANAVTGAIKTKIAGQAFSLDIHALDSGGTAAQTMFNGTVQVQLLGNTMPGAALDATHCPVASTVLHTQSVLLSNGKATLALPAVAEAWRDVRARIIYSGASPAITSCSRDNFAIRPANFAGMTVSDADSRTQGSARPLYNIAVSGGNVHRAGQPFRMAATAYNAAGAATANYAGNPVASLTACILPGTGCTLGTLATGTWSPAGGTLTTTSASYSDVGAFSMKWVDASFAAVDAADGSSAADRNIESAVFNVGRFVPDHFDLATTSVPLFKTFNDTACATRSFTYAGQPFGYLTLPQATITAKNATGGITLNYAGSLWKLDPAGVTQTYVAASGTLDTGLVGTPEVNATGSGAGTLTAHVDDVVAFMRATPVAPFAAAINLSMRIRDSAENAVSGNGFIDTTAAALFADITFDAGKEIRFGRLVLTNAHGSELLGLPVPIETQYWTGSGFARNAADACTRLDANQVALSSWRRHLNACETSVVLSGRFNAGRGNLRFTAPGIAAPGMNNSGSVDLTLQLGATGSGSSCVGGAATAVAGASQTWLQGAWTGGAFDQNPVARASFGLYRGSKSLIYQREMY